MAKKGQSASLGTKDPLNGWPFFRLKQLSMNVEVRRLNHLKVGI